EQLGNSFLAAYDCKNGEQKWKCRRRGSTTSYSVPCVFQPEEGADQLIFHSTSHGASGIDPQTGKQLWSLDVFGKRCVSSPVVAGGLVFGTCGQGGGGDAVVAVQPAASGQSARLAYQIEESAPYVVTPVAHNDLLFVWSDRGIVSCVDVANGHLHWRKRVEGNFSGSPVRVGEHLYCISEHGEVVVLDASSDYRLVARNDLGQPSRSTPAVWDGCMYLRTESELMSLGNPTSSK
ncbi:MAG: PQQ-binding-like beta-propeller repeat protein, partial [Planctomycetales bacterium]